MADGPGYRGGPFPDLPIDAFLYGHEGPWPQPSRDHPFGLAPAVYNIPTEEWDAWQEYVGDYYLKNVADFGVKAGLAAAQDAIGAKMGYRDLTDAEFSRLLGEGLFSKFLSPLDAQDKEAFKDVLTAPDAYEYIKSDYTCMRVVKDLHPGEAAAASVALLRRPITDHDFDWEIVAVQIQARDPKTADFVKPAPVFTPADGEAWRIARYFVLQGAIHRINLIDHTEVHFPPDAINAITKTVLPTDNLVFKLLRPHLWLSLCVNNTVLEGERSLINRDTWYPWSPFVAKGSEVRKLLPFGWWGSAYYAATDPYFAEPNSSYPAYRYECLPEEIPSRYGMFLKAYFAPIREFTRGVVGQMSAIDWQEIRFWADHIAVWIPEFPSGADLLGTGPDGKAPNGYLLADVLAHFIWNASVRHSADHQTLHQMVDGQRDDSGKIVTPPSPVPFILRVNPPLSKDFALSFVEVASGDLTYVEEGEKLVEELRGAKPLCWPADPISARWADLLFYMPHNTCKLIDLAASTTDDPNTCYRFDTPALKELVRQFQASLRTTDKELADAKIRFVPLEDIASSIQY